MIEITRDNNDDDLLSAVDKLSSSIGHNPEFIVILSREEAQALYYELPPAMKLAAIAVKSAAHYPVSDD